MSISAFSRLGSALAALAFAGLLSVAPHPAAAQDDASMQSPSIAVIDMQRILRESTAVQSIQQQIEQQRSSYQEELSRKEQELREADEELSRQRSILSSEAFQERREELEQRVSQLQRDIQMRKQQLDENYGQAMQIVQENLVEIVGDIAESRDVDVVLNKATVVLVRSELEITELALERLNDQLTSVDVPQLQN